MTQVSLMIHTASVDDFLSGQGVVSYFESLLANLAKQTYRSFELVYVDTYHAEQSAKFKQLVQAAGPLPFKIKHVPIHPAHRYWYDRGFCYISAAKNTGILHADGELLVTCDDAEFFPPEFLQCYWRHYKRGHYMHALHKRMRRIDTVAGVASQPITGDVYVNDHRWSHIKMDLPAFHRHGSWCFAGSSFSLGDALNLNGFNERMDGCKSLEDCDFGNRLRLLGRSFVMDPAGFAYIVDHGSYTDRTDGYWPETAGGVNDGQETRQPPVIHKPITNLIAVENHGMVRCAIELLDIVANRSPLNEQQLAVIQRETIKYRKFDPLLPEYAEQLAVWKGVPTFDLKVQRQALRNSPEWDQWYVN